MQCPHCGKIVTNSKARFCPECGSLLAEEELSPAADDFSLEEDTAEPSLAEEDSAVLPSNEPIEMPVFTQGTSSVSNASSGSGNSKVYIWILLAVIVFLLIVIGIMASTNNSDSSNEEVPSEQYDSHLYLEEDDWQYSEVQNQESFEQSEVPEVPDSFPGLLVQPDILLSTDEQVWLKVTTVSSNLNMRSGPGTNYDLVGQAPHDGYILQIGGLANDSGWVVVLCDDTYGWIASQYVTEVH